MVRLPLSAVAVVVLTLVAAAPAMGQGPSTPGASVLHYAKLQPASDQTYISKPTNLPAGTYEVVIKGFVEGRQENDPSYIRQVDAFFCFNYGWSSAPSNYRCSEGAPVATYEDGCCNASHALNAYLPGKPRAGRSPENPWGIENATEQPGGGAVQYRSDHVYRRVLTIPTGGSDVWFELSRNGETLGMIEVWVYGPPSGSTTPEETTPAPALIFKGFKSPKPGKGVKINGPVTPAGAATGEVLFGDKTLAAGVVVTEGSFQAPPPTDPPPPKKAKFTSLIDCFLMDDDELVARAVSARIISGLVYLLPDRGRLTQDGVIRLCLQLAIEAIEAGDSTGAGATTAQTPGCHAKRVTIRASRRRRGGRITLKRTTQRIKRRTNWSCSSSDGVVVARGNAGAGGGLRRQLGKRINVGYVAQPGQAQPDQGVLAFRFP